MSEKASVPLKGKVVEGDVIDFEIEIENWNKYKLADGTTIKMKLVVTQIVKTDEYNSKNEPFSGSALLDSC